MEKITIYTTIENQIRPNGSKGLLYDHFENYRINSKKELDELNNVEKFKSYFINNSVEFNLLRVNNASTDTLKSLAIEYRVSPFFTVYIV